MSIRQALSNVKREWDVRRMSFRTLPKLDIFKEAKGLKVHLGCGDDVRPGWINLDIDSHERTERDFYAYDLRRGVPLPDGSCSLIYSSHFFEHIPNAYGQHLMRESLRVLEAGARFRMCLPDWRNLIREYLSDDRSHWHLWEGLISAEQLQTMSWGDFMDRAIYENGAHVCFYDEDRAISVLRSIGFRNVRVAEFDEGLDIASELRRVNSFYIEAHA